MKNIWVLLGILGVLLLVVLVGRNHLSKRELAMKTPRDEAQTMIDLALSNSDLRVFLVDSAKSRFTEVSIRPPTPPEIPQTGPDGLTNPEWLAWVSSNRKDTSLHQMDEVIKTLEATPVGEITLSDPKDNPNSYDRTSIHLSYENWNIVKATTGSL